MGTTIIIVSYNNEELTSKFVNYEVCKCQQIDHVIIVNNSATKESNDKLLNLIHDSEIVNNLECSSSKVVILSSKSNQGFAKANNKGARYAIKHYNPDFLLFSNDDIIIKDENVVTKLEDKLSKDSTIGCIGPKIIGLSGIQQGPYPYRPFWIRYLVPTLLLIPSKMLASYLDNLYFRKAREGYHYAVMGCFFLTKTSLFVKCGMMDENTFLYREEEILAERFKKIGKRNYWLPITEVVHLGGETTKKYNRIASKSVIESDIYYYYHYKNYSIFLMKSILFMKDIRNVLVRFCRFLIHN